MPGAMPLCAEQLFVQAEALAVHRLAFSMFILPSFLPVFILPSAVPSCTALWKLLSVHTRHQLLHQLRMHWHTTSHDNFQAQQHLGMCIHTVQAQQISSLEMQHCHHEQQQMGKCVFSAVLHMEILLVLRQSLRST
jgi:hypothetical protein